ncbi:hypothetical protein OPU71_20865 [Niveibacterium sp. 24ML]|uniref:hypothetical protein n=1 Tax=Niveibacterium sp. 24ML TaxID=2985512 RepID=UPI0022721A35|nr:hypothetical protein [Niveibacterium sp. 24ML]MCX9158572.1 hypothetical protein [Niveibacterium sp. 24ML]
MNITDSVIEKLQRALDAFDEYAASFNAYRDDHDYLVLEIAPPANKNLEPFGLRFFYCEFLAGPTRWSNVRLSVSRVTLSDGEDGFEVKDSNAGFFVRCAGPISIADDPNQVFPRS